MMDMWFTRCDMVGDRRIPLSKGALWWAYFRVKNLATSLAPGKCRSAIERTRTGGRAPVRMVSRPGTPHRVDVLIGSITILVEV